MLVLGIDPGSRKTGFGLVQITPQGVVCLEGGTLVLGNKEPYHKRLGALHQRLDRLFAEQQPQVLAIERVFVGLNPAAALKLGQARGVVLALAGLYDVPVFEYAPCSIKQAVTGRGRASKEQVAFMVQRLLGLPVPPAPDASDALAVALCHTQQPHKECL